MHRRRRRTRRGPQGCARPLSRDQFMHPLPADPRRQGTRHGRKPRRRRAAASGAAGDGGPARLAVRLLHAGFRHEPVRALSGRRPSPTEGEAFARRRPRSARRQSLSLHRLSPDHRCGLRDGRLRRAGALVARRRAVAASRRGAARIAARDRVAPAGFPRAADDRRTRGRARARTRTHCCSRAAPMSVCG